MIMKNDLLELFHKYTRTEGQRVIFCIMVFCLVLFSLLSIFGHFIVAAIMIGLIAATTILIWIVNIAVSWIVKGE